MESAHLLRAVRKIQKDEGLMLPTDDEAKSIVKFRLNEGCKHLKKTNIFFGYFFRLICESF